MAKQRVSISRQIQKSKTYEDQERKLLAWKNNWYKDQFKTIYTLKEAIRVKDKHTTTYMLSLLDEMTERRFTALENIIKIMNRRDYELIHEGSNLGQEEIEISIDDEAEDKQANFSPVEENLPEQTESLSVPKKPFSKDDIKEFNVEEIIKCYNAGISLPDIGQEFGVSYGKIVKILVTAGVYSSEKYDKIKEMRQDGISDEEIRNRLGLSARAFNKFVPYAKGMYGLKEPTENAKRIRNSRKKSSTHN